jgi:glycine/D-amino acid oxidase-like deaminating enzyme
MTGRSDVIVVGAGIVGAACAHLLARAGARVTVLDAGPIAGGASSSGEGNLLVSDKRPGPELELMLLSRRLWDEIGTDAIELERKGGLVVAADPAGRERLAELAAGHRAAGLKVTELAPDELAGYEPRLADGFAGGAFYPEDAQLQPMLACAHLLRGLDVRCGSRVTAVEVANGAVTGVRLMERAEWSGSGRWVGGGGRQLRVDTVVNAAGVAAGELAATAGTRLPIEPRRGFVLVTEPLWGSREAPPIRHKVYAADYLDGVVSDEVGLQSSPVVEGTRSGTVLIGSSRERVGLDLSYPLPVLRRIAAQAVALFPFLAGVRLLRAYRGFRPFTPDHVPVIGPDPNVGGLWHATGHEGGGVGLAPATAALITAQITGTDPPVDPAPFSASRFA